MSRICAKIGKAEFCNPVFTGSGCFGHVYDMARFSDIPAIGAVTPKSVTKEARKGAPPPRIWHGYGVHQTTIALQNPGIDVYLRDKLPEIRQACRPDQLLISVAGNRVEDYVYCIERLQEAFGGDDGFAAFEINAACPAVAEGGGSFSRVPKALEGLVNAIRPRVKNTLIIKIITMFDCFKDSAKVVEACGADAVHIVNTCPGTAIDVEKKRPFFSNPHGGVSGPAILPWGVLRTWDVYESVKIPIIGSGGIYDLDGALQYFLAGASAIALGSAIFLDPMLPSELPKALNAWLEAHGLSHYSELIGAAH